MNDADRPRFAAMMTALAEYYRADISKPLVEMYWRSLKPFDLGDVERAAQLHLERGESGQFMPKIADLIKLIEGSAEQRALQAWSNFINAARRTSYGRTLVFDDPLIMAVVHEMGGADTFGNMTSRDFPFKQAEFVRRYGAYDARRIVPSHPPSISCDPHAHQLPPVFIGDQAQCQLIYSGQSAQALTARTAPNALTESKTS